MAMNRQKTFRPKPPDKGSFPLDHEGECKEFMVNYMNCLKKFNNDNAECRTESKAYLECRMSRGLMAGEKLSKLGYKENDRTTDNHETEQTT